MVNQKQTWVVTGASSGIGAAVVRRVREAGHQVLALDVNDTRGRMLADECGAKFLHCDVSQPDDWQRVVEQLDEFDALTHVHLNAGIQIAPPNVPLKEYQFDAMTIERYRRMMGVNVDGVVFGLQALLPLMKTSGAIVVTASLAGITPYSVDPLYSMSKHAVVGLVRSLAPTLAERGISIHAICPGGIDTEIIPDDQKVDGAIFMTPENVADEVIQLMQETDTGKTWAKVSEAKPAFLVRAPGDRG
ncbi:MAG: NAD(P)-dependent dehydrogenase (short-subunit alcohol dehydrogenase family) [Candidatus Azotimanducaceae bacterium]|jgi:NAD(P)-dependent dehydrogenase (short-subunit alcohol dehydrogenase family)